MALLTMDVELEEQVFSSFFEEGDGRCCGVPLRV